MEIFSITIDDNSKDISKDHVAIGRILIGGFYEDFHASLSYWNCEKYWDSWRDSLRRIVNDNKISALVSSMYDPKVANFIFWWILYPDDQVVYIQNHVLFMEELDGTFDESHLYDYIPQRRTVSEDGEKISEWTTSLESLKNCLLVIEDYITNKYTNSH